MPSIGNWRRLCAWFWRSYFWKNLLMRHFIDFRGWTLRVSKRCAEILRTSRVPTTVMINHCIQAISKQKNISMCWYGSIFTAGSAVLRLGLEHWYSQTCWCSIGRVSLERGGEREGGEGDRRYMLRTLTSAIISLRPGFYSKESSSLGSSWDIVFFQVILFPCSTLLQANLIHRGRMSFDSLDAHPIAATWLYCCLSLGCEYSVSVKHLCTVTLDNAWSSYSGKWIRKWRRFV